MAKLYIWFGGKLDASFSANLGNVGHVALEYGSQTNEYISFWPAATEGSNTKKVSNLLESQISEPIKSYLEDCEEIEREADLTIELNYINRAIVEAFWFRFLAGENRDFNIINQNCSTVVSKAVIVGCRLEERLKISEGNWFTDILMDDNWMITLTTVMGYLYDQIFRVVGIRSVQESFAKTLELLTSQYPRSLRKMYLYAFVKYHHETIWSPYAVALFATLVKQEFN